MIKKLKLSKLFWIALVTNYLFAVGILYVFMTVPDDVFDMNNTEHALVAFKLAHVRSMIVMFFVIVYPIVLLTSRKYITVFTVGLTAWAIAMYVDDHVVLYKIIEYPDRGLVVFLQTVRPIIIAGLIWMSFELTFRNYKKS